MPYTEMSLPGDIPWKRMGVWAPAIDTTPDNLQFPYKWFSSVALFYHEPEDLPPDYCNRRIVYLKVVATITNYQFTEEDVTVLDALDTASYAARFFEANITDSYPCYGALLQVGVYPNPSAGVSAFDYPYIQAAQPQKREMYEMVSRSGEAASQSASRLNINKGMTSTNTTENYDVDMGGKGTVSLGILGTWGNDAPGSIQSGTINRMQEQTQRVIATDSSRERRESHSYSTNISQLYTLLANYHLGTNRTVFFLEPRPHIQDQKFSFIRGLRRLEGIQEFFLVVNSPTSVNELCVEVALETAHALMEKTYQPRFVTLDDFFADPVNLEKTAAALGLDVTSHPWRLWAEMEWAWNAVTPSIRQWVRRILARDEGVSASSLSNWVGTETYWQLMRVATRVPEGADSEVRLIFEEAISDSGTFFVVGRRLHSCQPLRTIDQAAVRAPAPSDNRDGRARQPTSSDTSDSDTGRPTAPPERPTEAPSRPSSRAESAADEYLRSRAEYISGTDSDGSQAAATSRPQAADEGAERDARMKATRDAARSRIDASAAATRAQAPGASQPASNPEMSRKSHLSTWDGKPSIVFEHRHVGDGGVIGGSSASPIGVDRLNGLVQEVNRVLATSLGSRQRFKYGERGFLDTDFALSEICQLLDDLRAEGFENIPIADLPAEEGERESWRSLIGNLRGVLDLSDLSKTLIGKNLSEDQRKARRTLLTAALTSLKSRAPRDGLKKVNPLARRISSRLARTINTNDPASSPLSRTPPKGVAPNSLPGRIVQFGRYVFPKR